MNRVELINRLIQSRNYKRYLEIGVDTGFCFSNINIEHKDGVDPGSDMGGVGNFKHEVRYQMTSDEFFRDVANSVPKYDIIFIDGLHHSEQVTKDLNNGLKVLNKDGCIILHDCTPIDEPAQIVPRQQEVWNGDVWKSLVEYRKANPNTAFVIDSDYGLGIVDKSLSLEYTDIDIPDELTYQWYEVNKVAALNLKTVEEGLNILNL